MYLPIRLLLGPSGSGDKEHLRVGTDRLLTYFRRAEAADRGAQRRQLDRNLLNLNRLTLTRKGRMGSRIQQ